MEKNLVLDGVPLSDEEIAFIRNKRKPILKLDSLSRPKKNESIRLCIDFGTAVSKAWATGERLTQTYPLLLGRFEELEPSNVFGVISSIYISKDGKVFFGKAAVNQHISDPTPNRSRFDNIKFMISHEVPSVDLDEIPLTEQIDPTGSGLTKGDLLSLYFGWLTSVSLRALIPSPAAHDR